MFKKKDWTIYFYSYGDVKKISIAKLIEIHNRVIKDNLTYAGFEQDLVVKDINQEKKSITFEIEVRVM